MSALVRVRVRRMRCPVLDCKVQTFREQGPGPSWTVAGGGVSRLTAQVQRGGKRVTVPRVLGIDDFALRRGLVYATACRLRLDRPAHRLVVPGRTAGRRREVAAGSRPFGPTSSARTMPPRRREPDPAGSWPLKRP